MSALVAPHAFVIRNATLTIATIEFNNAASKARLVPDTPIQTLRTLIPDGVIQDVDSTVWTFQLSGVSDWIASGLADTLNTNAGTIVECVLAPRLLGRNATFSIMALPVDFGGDQGSFNTFDASFPVIGAPVFGTDS